MLVLTVKEDSSVTIATTDGTITIRNLRTRAKGVRMGIEAPTACTVLREGVPDLQRCGSDDTRPTRDAVSVS